MRNLLKAGIAVALSLIVIGLAYTHVSGINHASACGWGARGGSDYVPQQRAPGQSFANRPSLTKEQATEIVTNHVKRLNPALRIGRINDGGSFFEAEVLAENGEIVQVLGIDKQTGQIIVIK